MFAKIDDFCFVLIVKFIDFFLIFKVKKTFLPLALDGHVAAYIHKI